MSNRHEQRQPSSEGRHQCGSIEGSGRGYRPVWTAREPRWAEGISSKASRAIALGALLAAVWGALAWGDAVDLIDTREPSEAVYPPHDFRILYDHALHSRLMPCGRCHLMTAGEDGIEPDPIPTMESCGTCHPQAADTENRYACAYCHPDYRPVWPEGEGMMSVRDPRFPLIGPRPPVRLEANLHFSHGVHMAIPCTTCHPVENDGGASLPLEEQCVDCHQVVGASTACRTCHPAGEDGRLITRLPGTRSTSVQVLRPADHGGAWNHDHATAVRVEPTSCFVCHSEQSCLSCHAGALGIWTIHEPGYIEDHGLDARRSGTTCASCHQVSTYCVDCHVEAGYGDDGIHGPPQGYPHHPPGWYDIDGDHGRAAQRNLVECASCHQESHCARCHSVVSPHGPDFRSRCGSLQSANPAVCRRCHGTVDMEAFLGRCL